MRVKLQIAVGFYLCYNNATTMSLGYVPHSYELLAAQRQLLLGQTVTSCMTNLRSDVPMQHFQVPLTNQVGPAASRARVHPATSAESKSV